MNAHYVSIIVVCYNYAHLLPRTLKSIVSQSFTDYELIFVNNGSTDDTESVYESFMRDYPNIDAHYIKIDVNEGPSKGDNVGASCATGDYLIFVDADDWMDECCLSSLVKVAKETDADRIIGSYRYVNQDGVTIKEMRMQEGLNRWFYTMQQACLFKRAIYESNQIAVHDIIFLDAEKTLKYSAASDSVAFCSELCYNYYVHESTSNNTTMAEKIINDSGRQSYSAWIDIVREIFDSCSERDVDSCYMQIVRLYYAFIMMGIRGAPYKKAKQAYSMVHNYFISKFPDYPKKLDYSLLKQHMGSKSRKRMMKLMVLAERCHLFNLVIFSFLFVSKRRYITT